MIPAAFDYLRPTSLDEALAMLAEHGEDAKILAGGQSLLPLMKLRFATPELLIDAGTLSELSYIRSEGDRVAIGASTRYSDLLKSDVLKENIPLLPAAIHHVGDAQVRHRGTIGGTSVHGDPASDVPGALLALDAQFVLASQRGRRDVFAADFFRGFLDTDIAPDELLVEIRIPNSPGGWSFQKFTRRAQDWAIVGVSVATGADGPAVGLVNMGPTPLRATGVEQAIRAGASVEEAAGHADENTNPVSDPNASEAYRRHLARVLTSRALTEAGF